MSSNIYPPVYLNTSLPVAYQEFDSLISFPRTVPRS